MFGHLITDSPRNLKFSSNNQQFRMGERVSCMAEGNPLPDYEWQNLAKSNDVTLGPDLVFNSPTFLDDKMIYRFRCTARNMAGAVSEDFLFTIAINNEGKISITFDLNRGI